MSDLSKEKFNLRRDPFTEEDQSILCEKEELAIPGVSPFYIQLEEAPKYEDPSTVAIYLTDTLAEALDISETIVTVANGAYWAIDDVILVDDEQMLITGKSGDDLNVTRGYGGTDAATHTNGTRFRKLTAWTEVYTTPSQGEFQVHYGTSEIPYKRGLIRFHEDDGGKTVWVDYYKIGHYNWAEHINDLQNVAVINPNHIAEMEDGTEYTNATTSWVTQKSFKVYITAGSRIRFNARLKSVTGHYACAQIKIGSSEYVEATRNLSGYGWADVASTISGEESILESGWQTVELQLKMALAGTAKLQGYVIYIY